MSALTALASKPENVYSGPLDCKRWQPSEFQRLQQNGWFNGHQAKLLDGIVYESEPPARKRWTAPEFHRLREEGWFEGYKSILVSGEIILMPIPGLPHDQSLGLADYKFKSVFGVGYWVRIQQPLVLNLWTDPIPDLAVVLGSPREFTSLPSFALLVAEISDWSLLYDTGDKASLYATARIEDYWVVDLNNRQLIVFRDPQPDPDRPDRLRYAQVQQLDPSASIIPLSMPSASITVGDLLP